MELRVKREVAHMKTETAETAGGRRQKVADSPVGPAIHGEDMFFFRKLLLCPALSGTCLSVLSAQAFAQAPIPLSEAISKLKAEHNRWAFTMKVTELAQDPSSKPPSLRVERFDPSLAPDKQWELLSVDDKPPSEKDLKRWQKQKKRQSQSKDDRLGNLIDLEQAKLSLERPDAYVYEVPLKKGGSNRLPPEKIQLLLTVSKPAHDLQHLSLKTREAFRVYLFIKITGASAEVDFASVDDTHPPQPAFMTGEAAASMFFKSVGGHLQIVWNDYKRVKPWDERFEVKLGELKALDF
jgi:hypothetical protein